jgi:cobalamin biosynthesis Mg chelatase CobN
MPIVVFMALAVVALMSPSSALAQRCEGRPGASAIQQYCEAIPQASGAGQRPSGGGQNTRGAASPQVRRQLQNAGADGAIVLGLLAASSNNADDGGNGDGTANESGGPGGSDAGAGGVPSGTDGASADPKVAEGGVLRAVSSAVSNGSTVGNEFSGLLVGMAVLAAAFGWISLRRRHAS